MAISYILFSKLKNQFYVGSSRANDLTIRLKAHNAKKVKSTKSGCPWVKIAVENFESYTEARRREIFLKSGVGREWLKSNLGYIKKS